MKRNLFLVQNVFISSSQAELWRLARTAKHGREIAGYCSCCGNIVERDQSCEHDVTCRYFGTFVKEEFHAEVDIGPRITGGL